MSTLLNSFLLFSEAQHKASRLMSRLTLDLQDKVEGVVWLDRAEITDQLSFSLDEYETETLLYVSSKTIHSILSQGDKQATDQLFDNIVLKRNYQNPYVGLCFVIRTLEEKVQHHYPVALEYLERIIPTHPGDPNLSRLRIMLTDLVNGTDRYSKIQKYLRGKICAVPFKHAETALNGAVYLCCSGWLPRSAGNLLSKPDLQKDVFNSKKAIEVRTAIKSGNYRYCNWLACPRINSQDLDETLSPNEASEVSTPRDLFLAHDATCNLSCPSCRRDVISIGEEGRSRLDDQFIPKLNPYFPEADVIKITGSGDPFASKHFRQLIKGMESKKRNLHIHTNAQLFTPKTFSELSMQGRIKIFEVSIDASTAETYRVVRRGGDFGELLQNLEYVAELRRSGEIPFLRLDFVVQQRNYREMPAFVELGRRFLADEVLFTAIRNWGTFSQDEFVRQNICSIQHPEFPELAKVLSHPSLFDPVVDIGSLSYLREAPQ